MAEEAPAGNAGNKIVALLTRKVFGIPVGVFVMLAAAVLLYFALRLKPASDSEELTDGPATDGSGDGFEGGGDVSESGVGTPIFIAHPPPDDDAEPTTGDTPEKTNQDWATDAITWLITEGNNATVATRAITRYLLGEATSMEERTLVDKALVKFGPPPEGFVDAPTPNNNTNGPPVKQGNPPTTHTVKGKADNNPNELARLYYGREDAEAVRYIEANNTSQASPYRKGAVITIPRYRVPKYYKSTPVTDTATEIARKNGTSGAEVIALNPGMKFPVKAGTRVRVQ